ncbi:MAG: hypothetical protein OES47_13190 [Acidobacteriota bacterium]|nr:hypothetical protein [Acidobacteriota bacterium]
MRITKLALLLAILAALVAPLSSAAEENPEGWSGEMAWPREYSNEAGAKLTMYQPQVTSWEGAKQLEARVAIAFSAPGAEAPSLGTFEIGADTVVDLDTRLVKMTSVEIIKHRFPSLDDAMSQKLLAKLEELMPKDELIIDLDRVLANLERAEVQGKPVKTNTEPPKIFVSQKPAVLVILDGKPIWAKVKDNDLEYAVNTNWDLFQLASSSTFYLRNEDAWLKASKLTGPWSPAGKLPKAFKKLPKDNPNWKDVKESLPGEKIDASQVPSVKMSEAPAELIVTVGRPKLEEIEGTELLAVVNTESDLFLHGKESRYYYLVSGRWFRADGLGGPWQFASHDLPEDFAKIPSDHPLADVRASVPGTPEAQEAVLLAQIPKTAAVERSKVTAEVSYVGEPEFKQIEGTTMYYATNTQSDVIRVGDMYYLCYQGVWFAAASASGPWEVTESVPDTIYTIPATSPVHHTTYVSVYDYNPYSVTFGYTSGYWGVYMSYGCMVYGTGWYYNPYYYYGPHYGYPVYYGYPYSYGVGAYYNHYTGTYGRGASLYGPYGGVAGGARFNPSTGTYSRGAVAHGPYNAGGWAEAYNPRTGTYAQTRQGANAYSSWGTTGIQRGNDWARTARYSDSRGTAAGVRTSRGGGAVALRGDQGGATVGRTAGGDLYAGKDGNVYRRGDNGWQRREGNDWKSTERTAERTRDRSGAADRARSSGIDRSTIDQLNRDRSSRTRGAQRSGQYGSWQSSGGSRPSRGSFGGRSGGYSGRSGGFSGGGARRRR